MSLIDIIKSRHSIRKYTDRQICREDLEKILEAGNYAPSAGGASQQTAQARTNQDNRISTFWDTVSDPCPNVKKGVIYHGFSNMS